MSSFKIFFSPDNIRRFRTDRRLTFDQFIELMCKQYPSHFHPELRIQYTDSEGDRIDVNSQPEWEEMFAELKAETIIKIHVVEGKTGQYFKDGPAPEPMYFHDKQKEFVPENADELKSRIPQCLQELWPSKKILPHNVPNFLSDCVTVTNLHNNEVDLDVDVQKLENVLFRKGLDALEEKEHAFGRKLFFSLTILKPLDPLPRYNLACAESLLGNVNEAIGELIKAVELGYRDVNHIRSDEDLLNLRSLDVFNQICNAIEFNQIPQLISSTQASLPQKIPLSPLTPAQHFPPAPTEIPVVPQKTAEKQEEIPVEIPVVVEKKTDNQLENLTESFASVNLTDSMLMDPSALNSGREKWRKQLETLHELGFVSDSILIPLLEANKGSVENTVQELLLM